MDQTPQKVKFRIQFGDNMEDLDIRWQQRYQNFSKALALLNLPLFNQFEETMKGLRE